ncbi:MAG: circularly permuted type 2 ATP-grasp protein [Actinomycetota bacterium]|nr:circularly permuted type 2 ATP-grasp protein [Actinomycetota bacterium]
MIQKGMWWYTLNVADGTTSDLTPKEGYPAEAGVFDEAFDHEGRVRPPYEELFAGLDLDRIAQAAGEVADDLAGRGVEFGPPGARSPFRIDGLPRLIPGDTWTELERGLIQRVRALNHFLADAYGERRVVEAGIIRPELVDEALHFEPILAEAGIGVEAEVAGPDLVRGPDGGFSVIEDNLRSPSGIAYAAAGRQILETSLNAPFSSRSPEPAYELLGEALRARDPGGDGDPAIAVLSDGPISNAWFEHRNLAERLGVPVVIPGDLRETGGRLIARTGEGDVPVDVLYNRTSTERLTLTDGTFTPLGELVIGPMKTHRLACVNSFGTGIADDKALHCYVDRLIRFYLDEEPLLENTPSFDLGDPAQRDEVMGRFDELVIKPRWTFGGEDIVIGPRTPGAKLDELRSSIRKSPERFIAQEMVMLSRHPTFVEGALQPRHVDLRPYVFTIGDRVEVAPVALTRFARDEGDMIVSSTRGGGAKDTWILDR